MAGGYCTGQHSSRAGLNWSSIGEDHIFLSSLLSICLIACFFLEEGTGNFKYSELAQFFVILVLHLQNVLQTLPIFHRHLHYGTLVYFLYPRVSIPEIKVRLENDGNRVTAFPEMWKL